MRQQMKQTWRVHGIILKGGLKPNIIPDLTVTEWYTLGRTNAGGPAGAARPPGPGRFLRAFHHVNFACDGSYLPTATLVEREFSRQVCASAYCAGA
jgi:hypothetical protein